MRFCCFFIFSIIVAVCSVSGFSSQIFLFFYIFLYFLSPSLSLSLSFSLLRFRESQLEEVDKQTAEQDLAPILSHNATLNGSKAQSEARGAKLDLICIKKKGRAKCR